MKNNDNNQLTAIDLFCGCGGLSYGFVSAGYKVLLGVDNDEAALNTFEKSHPDSKILKGDLSKKETIQKMKEITNVSTVDLIIGGPPCQGFSLTGNRMIDDERNKLYLGMLEAVKEFEPNAFVLENVVGLVGLFKGKVKDQIIADFTEVGYNVQWKILNAADYGVPQVRKRVFFIGIKEGLGEFEFPESIKNEGNYVTCGEAIGDLPSLEHVFGEEVSTYPIPPQNEYQSFMRERAEKSYNHVATNHTEQVKHVISLVPEGGNHKDLPPGVGEHRKFNEAWTRYHSQKPSRTIDTGHRNHFHYKYNRVPTVRENARLQSFPDDFVFYGTRTQQNRQVGNAVPPLLGYHLGMKLFKYIGGKYVKV